MNARSGFKPPRPEGSVAILPGQALNVLMPMHALVTSTGHIKAVGPTLAKLRSVKALIGKRFLEVFEVKRPIHIFSYADLLAQRPGLMRLQFRGGDEMALRGVFVPLPLATGEATTGQDMLVNLSLGTNMMDAVQRYELTSADFAPSDPTVDMLYLMEAKSVVLEESKRLNARLEGARVVAEEQAFSDTLTGLQNRRGLDATMERLIGTETPFALMNLDLDFFKQVNDTFGHGAGDQVLRHVAGVLLDEVRGGDLVARTGGDEFVLVFSRCVDLSVLEGIAWRIIARLEEPIIYEGNACKISASIGTTLSTYYRQPMAERMMGDADLALYASKKQGRACHTVFKPENTDVNAQI